MDKLFEKFNKLTEKQKILLALGIFVLLIVAFYGNTLLNGYVMDDRGQIEGNIYLRSFEYLPKTFTSCIWESSNRGCYGRAFYYRPIHFLSALITYQISSQAWFFHLMNLLYYLTIAGLLFYLAKLLTKKFFVALLAAVIFLAHPIHSEVVTWVSAVPELTFTIFSLLAIILYIHYRRANSPVKLFAVYAVYFLAVLSKEPAILLPFMFVALDMLFFKFKIKDLVRVEEIKKYAAYPALFVVYFLMRRAVLGVGGQYGQFSFAERIHATTTLFGQYIEKLFVPYPLSAFYEFEKSSNFLDLTFLTSAVVVALFVAALVFSIKKQQPLFSFSLIWFALFLSPVLILLGGVGENIFSERYLFVPSIGFALIGGYLLAHVAESIGTRLRKPKYVIAAVILIIPVIASWAITFPRNYDWKSPEIFYTATLAQNANAHILRRELGEVLFLKGELERSREHFEYLVEHAPDWKDITMAYKGLGDYYRVLGDKEATLKYYIKSTETGHSPRDFVVYNDVGVIYMDQEKYLTGFAYFCQSMQLLPEDNPGVGNFNASLSLIESEYLETGGLLQGILDEFQPSSVDRIVFVGQRCDAESCQHAFSFQSEGFEIIPPFLISASVPHAWRQDTRVSVEITDQGFDPEANLIILETDVSYEDADLTFLFPTCSREYYEVIAGNQQ